MALSANPHDHTQPVIEMKVVRQITGGKAAVLHYIEAEAKKAEHTANTARGKHNQGLAAARAMAFREALAIVVDTTDL
jgi:hypothetical protein